MGKHYVPEYYLKGFTETADSSLVWVYDKKEQRMFRTGLSQIANEKNYYSIETETFFSKDIERPANSVLKKIRNQETINEEDKVALIIYVILLMRRGPPGREQAIRSAPRVAERVVDQLNEIIDRLVTEHPEKRDLYQKRRQEMVSGLKQLETNFPQEVWEASLRPELTKEPIALLSAMTWDYLVFERDAAFITSDNPVFYFRQIGMNKPDSQLLFPISSHIALLLTWRPGIGDIYWPVGDNIVHEANRRTASAVYRFAFCAEESTGILNLVKRRKYRFKRIALVDK